MAPLLALYYVTNAAERVNFADNKNVEFGFSPKSMNFVKKPNEDYLKAIDSQFKDSVNLEDGDKSAF